MNLETKQLLLRSWKMNDVEDLYYYAKDPDVGPRAGWMPHSNLEESEYILRQVLMVPQTYAIFHKETKKVIGSIGVLRGSESRLMLPDTEVELGFWIGKPYWGRGLTTEAVEKIVAYTFQVLEVEKIWCNSFEDNYQSQCVQKKCGFFYFTTIENMIWPVGNRTVQVYMLTKEQWKLRKK